MPLRYLVPLGLLFPVLLPAADLPVTAQFRAAELPVRALMVNGVTPDALAPFLAFVRDDLPREGVNTLIFQIDYGYRYESHPEMATATAYTKEQVKLLVQACRAAHVRLIPLVNCLGHQSWAKATHQLLTVYPQFDETPGRYPDNEGVYCRSYCPNHPEVHRIVFDLLDEIATVFEADAVHVGMDEVFLLGEDACPRCRGRDKAELFAQEVRTLHDFLAGRHLQLWLWGDRFIDGPSTGLGKWEASFNSTARAIDLVPKDIVICDWHYESAAPTPAYFALKGFDVVVCSYNKAAVGVAEAEAMVRWRQENQTNPALASRFLGVMVTNWNNSGGFAAAYHALQVGGTVDKAEPVRNFIDVFARVRALTTK